MTETDLEAAVLAEMLAFDEYGIRRAFNDVDMTDINSNTYELPVPVDQEPTEPIPEGSLAPRKGTEHQSVTLQFDKFGFEVTDDVDREDIEDQVEMLYAAVASEAAREVYDSTSVSWTMADNRLNIVRDAVIEAGSTVSLDRQDLAIVPQVLGESIADDDPAREWDEIVEDIQESLSIEVVTDPFNTLRGSDVLVVDTDFYGYEGVRTETKTNAYTEYENHDPVHGPQIPEEERTVQNEVVQAFTRIGFAVIDSDAGHLVRFGRV